MGGLINESLDINEKDENKNEGTNKNDLLENEKIKIIERKTLLVSRNRDCWIWGNNKINYIDEIKSLICFSPYKIYFFSYPSFIRNVDFEEFINTMDIYYYNYQKNSNKLYVNYKGKEYTNLFLIQNKTIKLLFEKIPLAIEDLIEISSQKIIVLHKGNNICSCFEFKNNEYEKIKTFRRNRGKIYNPKGLQNNEIFIYSIGNCPKGKKFFIANKIGIQVFDSKTLELIYILFIDNNDICFLNYNYFVTIYTRDITLFDFKTFKKLDSLNVFREDGGRLQTLGDTGYFIASQSTNVADVKILEIKNNKINYVRYLADNLIPYNSSIYFDNTLCIDGCEEEIRIFKLDFK